MKKVWLVLAADFVVVSSGWNSREEALAQVISFAERFPRKKYYLAEVQVSVINNALTVVNLED